MKAYKCDRCGKFFELTEEEEKKFSTKYKMFDPNKRPFAAEEMAFLFTTCLIIDGFDLCPDCRESLAEWVKGNK